VLAPLRAVATAATPQSVALQSTLLQARQGLNFLSHELRTPLQALLALATCIQEESLQPSICSHAGDMQHALTHMHVLLNDMLDLAKAEHQALRLQAQPFDLYALLHRVLRLHGPLAQTQGVALQHQGVLDLPLWLWGDGHRLEQMLNNLLANALKFTEQGCVVLECTATPGAGDVALCLAVRDTGIGISQSTLRRLFQPFAQADAAVASRFGGTGLGLVLVQTLAQAMGGHLDVQSTPGVGSVFSLHLQLPCAQQAAGAVAFNVMHNNKHTHVGLRLLLVDDHPINTKVLRHF
jgi:signal transduction histidine kinase